MLLLTENRDRRVVSLWCDSLFGFYSLKPLFDRLRSLGVETDVYTPKAYHPVVAEYLGVPESSLICLTTRHPILSRILARLEYLYVGLRIASCFSTMYARFRKDGRFVKAVGRFVPKAGNPNAAYRKFFGRLVPNPFREGPVVAVTRVTAPYWLSAATRKVHVVMESWDHPVKTPFFHPADSCHTWNSDLARDIEVHQRLAADGRIYPLKFRYLQEIARSAGGGDDAIGRIANPAYRRHLEELPAGPFLTYVATTQSGNRGAHEEEMLLIEQLCQWTARNRMALYVKPKPNGNAGEYDSLARHPHVTVGIYGDSESRQMLDPDYHLYRYALLKRSRMVINVATTFVLEAALVGVPVVQLKAAETYPHRHFKDWGANPHVGKYLNAGHEYAYDGTPASLDAILEDALAGGGSRAHRFSLEISRWLGGGRTVEESVESLASAVLEDAAINVTR